MTATEQLGGIVGVKPACEALGVARATVYRRRRRVRGQGDDERVAVAVHRSPPARALSDDERREVLRVLHSDRFVDVAPAEVVATLLDEDRYLCSERTMYRLLSKSGEVREAVKSAALRLYLSRQ